MSSVSSLSTLSSLSTATAPAAAGVPLRGGENMGFADAAQIAKFVIVASAANAGYAGYRMWKDDASNDDITAALIGGESWWAQFFAYLVIVVAAILFFRPKTLGNDLLRTLVALALVYSGLNAGYSAYRMAFDGAHGPSDLIAHLPHENLRIAMYAIVAASAIPGGWAMLSDPPTKR